MAFRTQTGYSRFLILPLAVLWGILLTVSQASACDVPVFRYALERWSAGVYEVVCFHRGAPASVEPWVKTMEKSGANVESHSVDVAGPLEADTESLWKKQNNPPLPWMVVFYPVETTDTERIAWSGPLTAENVGALTNSPARNRISQRLRRGDAAVWVLLESGDKAQDDRAAAMLDKASRKIEKDQTQQPDANDPKSNGGAPSKIAFSTCRVSRGDATEQAFIGTLLRLDDDLKSQTGPIVFPVFGRGRVLSVLTGTNITQESIEEIGGFLIGDCSCQVKEQIHGTDLLIAANWDELPSDPVVNAAATPALVGLGQYAATSNTANTVLTGTSAQSAPDRPVFKLYYSLAAGLVILIAAVGIIRFFVGKT